MSSPNTQMIERRLGTVGLVLDMKFYGMGSIVDMGTYYEPGLVRIPAEDADTLKNKEII